MIFISSIKTASSSDPSKAMLMQHFLKDLTIMPSGMHISNSYRHSAMGGGAMPGNQSWSVQ